MTKPRDCERYQTTGNYIVIKGNGSARQHLQPDDTWGLIESARLFGCPREAARWMTHSYSGAKISEPVAVQGPRGGIYDSCTGRPCGK